MRGGGGKIAKMRLFLQWPARISCVCLLLVELSACSTEGNVGMIMSDSANVDVSDMLSMGQEYQEHGTVKGRARHYHILLIRFGNSDISVALNEFTLLKKLWSLGLITTGL